MRKFDIRGSGYNPKPKGISRPSSPTPHPNQPNCRQWHRIAIGSDHAGYSYKEEIKRWLKEWGWEVKDFGAFDDKPSDYPVFACSVAEAVGRGDCALGILICGTGMGMAIAANKVDGVRATACYSPYMAKVAREHNNSNILALGARITALHLAKEIVRAWLETEFEGEERHLRRLEEIRRIEVGRN